MDAFISIQLGGDLFAVIDEADYSRTFSYLHPSGKEYQFRICDLSWHSDAGGGKARRKTTYARSSVRRDGRKFSFRMHTLILGKRDGFVIDHEDNDGLNNTRQNLSHKTNGFNVAKGKAAARLKQAS